MTTHTTESRPETIGIITIELSAIELFTNQWPCHGFDPDCDLIVIAYDLSTDDLIDLDACDNDDNDLDTSNWDGAALSALVDDAIKNHTILPRGFLGIGTSRAYRASEVPE
jgi:hypothetical protein